MSLRERTQVAKARMTDIQRMTAEQAETLKRLAKAAYDLQAFRPDLTRAEADQRIAMLKAKLKLESQPPHTE
jgi:VIT1/CCC1 family predicted Fe2+/Mn2+ transporter